MDGRVGRVVQGGEVCVDQGNVGFGISGAGEEIGDC